jgi:hypothetical protein
MIAVATENKNVSIPLSLSLSPTGNLYLYSDPENEETVILSGADKIKDSFAIGSAVGLLHLGVMDLGGEFPPSLAYWQGFSRLFATEVSKLSGLETFSFEDISRLSPPLTEFESLVERAPFMRGGEYLNSEVMITLWHELSQAFLEEISHFKGNSIQDYLAAYNPAWNKVGRVCFHLAENKTNSQHPFAFLATYTTRLSNTEGTKPQEVKHLPLERALKEYSGEQKRVHLLSLLLPVQKSSEKSTFIKQLVDAGAIYKPLAWTAQEAHQFLKDIPLIEEAGVIVKIPNWWNPRRPPRPQVTVAVGNVNTSTVGLDALLDFDMGFALPDGEQLTSEEVGALLKGQDPLVQIKGQWVEVDTDKLDQVLTHWKQVERQVKREGLSFAEGMRLLAGAFEQQAETSPEDVAEWSKVIEGPWLNEALSKLRHPEQTKDQNVQTILQKHLQADLRSYQQAGVQWLWWLYSLRLGGCLADDMGLGKTVQVLALLLLVKHLSIQGEKRPSLLILPASLLGNWQAEINKFVPGLKIWIVHSSASNGEIKGTVTDFPDLTGIDLVITTYAYAHRLPWLSQLSWNLVILDEAQSIKNPSAKQTQTIKKLKSYVRFALTGTPVENRLLDLWSLFDFVAPGLLGSSRVFSNYGKKALKQSEEKGENGEGRFYAAVRHLVSPYILRRLKSDKQIIADLPDKAEVMAYCSLTKQQIILYQYALKELSERLKQDMDGIQRRGLVLSYLTRFKQICNHPSQWLGHGQYEEQESGKFIRLKEICESIREKQEKVLIFTQFREIIPALHDFLSNIFGQEGLILHGQTAIKNRARLVDSFQQEQGFPFFVLSLKAGGTGLNLTKASHVIHFDRWWNPAVENQATDRAYRIGQKKNVLVHKFVCQGTIEEKIDELLNSKKGLSDELLTLEKEINLTELSNAELLDIVTLDIHRALGESS